MRAGKEGSVVDAALVTSLGLAPEAVARLMRDIGFRAEGQDRAWIWRGKERKRATPTRVSPAFAALAGLQRG